jgi:Family of unknown function (DUF6461)
MGSGVSGRTSDFDWFKAWLDRHVMLCLSFARNIEPIELMRILGANPETVVTQTLLEAVPEDRVRVGQRKGWSYAVEHRTVMASDHGKLKQLSKNGEAFVLCYTPTISTFLYASNEEWVSGFDMDGPQFRYGSQPNRFEAEIAAAGFPGPGRAGGAAGARFVAMLFGIEIDREMLEGALSSALLAVS